MKILTKIDVMSTAKIYAIMMAIFGLVMGIMLAIMNYFLPTATIEPEVAYFPFGWSAIIIFPIMYGIMGFLTGALMAWLYNTLSAKIGGIKLEIK